MKNTAEPIEEIGIEQREIERKQKLLNIGVWKLKEIQFPNTKNV